jgi:hypothetical protein
MLEITEAEGDSSTATGAGEEGKKEKGMNRAALSIAELGQSRISMR